MAKKNSVLQILLYYFISLCFALSVVVIITSVYFELFSDGGKIGSTSISIHHSEGYSLPVKVNISIPDSVVSYQGDNFSGSANYYKFSKNSDFNKKVKERINQNNCKKTTITNKVLTCLGKDYSFKLHPTFSTTGNIVGKSSDTTVFAIQIIYNYLSFIMIILILYQLMKILRSLSFTPKLIWRVKIMGIVILIQEIGKFVIIQFIDNYYYPIFISSTLNGRAFENAIKVNINPSSNFNTTLFIVGISLLVLSKLLKQGYFLKEENELTI